MEPLHAAFDSYKLDDLDRSWINQVFDSGFSNVDNVPVDYLMFLTSSDMLDLLKDTCAIIKHWISISQDDIANKRSELSWETLIALNIEVQGLLAVLAYLMKKGQSFDADQDSRQSCLRATSLYFVLLTIPGSNAFQAFQPNLYETALRTLELSQRLRPPKGLIPKQCGSDSLEDYATDENQYEFCSALSKSQALTLTSGLNAIMYDLVVMLKSAYVMLEIRSLEITIYYLIEMTKLLNETANDIYLAHRQSMTQGSTNSLAHNAYVALEQICNKKYAPVAVIARLISKYSLSQFIVGNMILPAKQLALVRESTLYFFKNVLANHGEDAQSAISILIQHTMNKCPERLEGRQKQAMIIVKLFNLCRNNETAFSQCIRDLVRLSYHNKVMCRIFAQEIIGRYIAELSTMKTYENNEGEKSWPTRKIEKILLASALGRCIDVSSMVRGRAIATFAEFTDSIESPEVKELFANHESPVREMPSLDELENAIETENVDSLVPNGSGIIAMLKNRLEDERALVRKSAVQALRNGVLVFPELLASIVPLIRENCRDAVFTVRRYAIRALTTLLERFPETPELCEGWVDSVVPRIFDSEAKVQEEVLASLEKLVIEKIGPHSFDTETNNLPWRILNEIAINKMGDHITRACNIWSQSGTITNKTISLIKSHIDTNNNVAAWFLLASISDNKMLSNMESYYQSCGNYIVETEHSDVFFASLTMRVLKNCWQSFDDLTLDRLRRELVTYLKNYSIEVVLIRICMEILLDITRHLEKSRNDGERSTILTELMRLSEETIDRIDEDEHDENFGIIIFRATCTLGHASFLSWEPVSLEIRRILQGFLLERQSLPECLSEKEELQGVAISVLGQQALIDRETAVEMTPIFGRLLWNVRDDLSKRNLRNRDRQENIANGSIVRINAAKALADICVRFTSLVEPYLSDMCISMKDPNPEVRQVILVIFIQLLVEDTIKINEAFFFHILTMLVDVNTTIRDMTIFLIKERLLTKNKHLITQQFINSIFHFNDYKRRTSGINRRKIRRENGRRALSLAGATNTEKRRMIYDFMLENLDPPGRLTVISKLTGQILNTRSNYELDIESEKGICVVRDVLYVVSSEHLQPNSCSRQISDDDNVGEGTTTTNNSAMVEAMKKHRVQVFLPNLVELKRRCQRTKSPLVEDVAKFLISAISDCGKEALTSLYNEYPKLDREIQRDIRQYSDRTRDETSEKNGMESNGHSEKEGNATTSKISNVEKHSSLIDPNRTPKIVLRRLSTLTYPEINGRSTRSSLDLSDHSSDANAPKSPIASWQTTPKSSRRRTQR